MPPLALALRRAVLIVGLRSAALVTHLGLFIHENKKRLFAKSLQEELLERRGRERKEGASGSTARLGEGRAGKGVGVGARVCV